MPRVRCHRRGKQNPPASVAQTETPRNSSRLENSAWNSLRDRALATGRPLAPAAGGRPRRHYTSYGAPWDNGISLGNRVGPEVGVFDVLTKLRVIPRPGYYDFPSHRNAPFGKTYASPSNFKFRFCLKAFP